MSPKLAVQYPAGRKGVPAPETVRIWLRAALKGHRRRADLTVRFVSWDEGAELNRRWREKRGPTNVLAFRFGTGAEGACGYLGDIAICVPVAQNEALAQHKALKAHCAHLVVHGALHLLGFDHMNDADAERMEARETAILSKLGYPDPYLPRDEA